MKTARERFNELTLMSDDVHAGDFIGIMQEYAFEVAQQSLMDASDNATCSDASWNAMPNYTVDTNSILNTKIITP